MIHQGALSRAALGVSKAFLSFCASRNLGLRAPMSGFMTLEHFLTLMCQFVYPVVHIRSIHQLEIMAAIARPGLVIEYALCFAPVLGHKPRL